MAGDNRLRILYLLKILWEETDEEHALKTTEIIEELEKYGSVVERKTLAKDITALQDFGLDILCEKKEQNYYRLVNRGFELAELKLLVDSVQSSKFITEKKSGELIRKIEGLTGRGEAKELQRQVLVSGRLKADNEKIYYNVDRIHTAISKNVQIRFKYFQWNEKKEQILRHGGKSYEVSPWTLCWDDDNYYMIGFDAGAGQMRHYRVDKMMDIELSEKRRDGMKQFHSFNVAEHTAKVFGMFDGDEEQVTLRVKNGLAGVIIDRFGKDVPIRPDREGYFRVRVKVAVSLQFFGWIAALGEDVEIIAPEAVVERMRDLVESLKGIYG